LGDEALPFAVGVGVGTGTGTGTGLGFGGAEEVIGAERDGGRGEEKRGSEGARVLRSLEATGRRCRGKRREGFLSSCAAASLSSGWRWRWWWMRAWKGDARTGGGPEPGGKGDGWPGGFRLDDDRSSPR